MMTTRAHVAKEIRMVTRRIRDRCTSINSEADDFGRGRGMGYSSNYISEKAERIKMDADDLHRLNGLFARFSR
jgi:hypothetical protein